MRVAGLNGKEEFEEARGRQRTGATLNQREEIAERKGPASLSAKENTLGGPATHFEPRGGTQRLICGTMFE